MDLSEIAAQLPGAGNLPFPAKTRQASGQVGGVLTDVMSIQFADRILVTIIQNGRLAQWVGDHIYNLIS